MEGAYNLRKEFLDWQRTFYTTSLQQAATAPVQGYVFGDGADKNKTNLFVTMLLRHRIEIYTPKMTSPPTVKLLKQVMRLLFRCNNHNTN